MSIIERARSRVEEARTKVMAIRGGGSNPQLPTLEEIREKGVLGALGGSSHSPELLKEVREKGVLKVLGEKFPRVKEIRERRLLRRGSPEPKGEVAGEIEGEGMATLRIKKGVHGEAI